MERENRSSEYIDVGGVNDPLTLSTACCSSEASSSSMSSSMASAGKRSVPIAEAEEMVPLKTAVDVEVRKEHFLPSMVVAFRQST